MNKTQLVNKVHRTIAVAGMCSLVLLTFSYAVAAHKRHQTGGGCLVMTAGATSPNQYNFGGINHPGAECDYDGGTDQTADVWCQNTPQKIVDNPGEYYMGVCTMVENATKPVAFPNGIEVYLLNWPGTPPTGEYSVGRDVGPPVAKSR